MASKKIRGLGRSPVRSDSQPRQPISTSRKSKQAAAGAGMERATALRTIQNATNPGGATIAGLVRAEAETVAARAASMKQRTLQERSDINKRKSKANRDSTHLGGS